MQADDLIRYAVDLGLLALVVIVAAQTLRRRHPLQRDASLFFGTFAAVALVALLRDRIEDPPEGIIKVLTILALGLPYLQLRMLRHFTRPALMVQGVAVVGFVVLMVGALFLNHPYSEPYVAAGIAYFATVSGYSAWKLLHTARRSRGVTQGRLYTLGSGIALFLAAFVLASIPRLIPGADLSLTTITRLTVLASICAFFLAFAPPKAMRRQWREGELRSFLYLIATTPATTPLAEVLPTLSRSIAGLMGARAARIGIWDEARQRFQAPGFDEGEQVEGIEPASSPGPRAFTSQQPLYIGDTIRADPDNAALYERLKIKTLLIAPITAGRRWGVVSAFSDRPSAFDTDDLELLTMLAELLARFLERWELAQHSVELRAREEAVTLQGEFLAAAAHDLRGPLTVILGRAALAQRALSGEAPDDFVETVLMEARRMQRLTEDLLDASRPVSGRLIGELDLVNITDVVREAAGVLEHQRRAIRVQGKEVLVEIDRNRMRQVFENLIGNAVKFSTDDTAVSIAVDSDGNHATVTVRDHGIGIPTQELELVFERFRRGSNAEERGFRGSGVGLHLCKRIVEEHGGRVWAESPPQGGTLMYVQLPLHDGILERP